MKNKIQIVINESVEIIKEYSALLIMDVGEQHGILFGKHIETNEIPSWYENAIITSQHNLLNAIIENIEENIEDITPAIKGKKMFEQQKIVSEITERNKVRKEILKSLQDIRK